MDRIAILTGGASGIGAAVGRRLARAGNTVVLADIDDTGARRQADEITRTGGRASAAHVDVRFPDQVQRLVDETVATHGRVDLLFNNAGIGIGGDTTELELAHWDRAIDVNLRGVIHGMAAALPHMLRQGDGHIVNTASLAGLFPSPYLAPYAATKHAVVGMTLSLRAEFASRGVRFTVLCPGFTDTPILDRDLPSDLPAVSTRHDVRQLAADLPGGIYELDGLVSDILKGVARNEAMVVAPASARAAWRSWRLSPSRVLTMLTRRAGAQRRYFASEPLPAP